MGWKKKKKEGSHTYVYIHIYQYIIELYTAVSRTWPSLDCLILWILEYTWNYIPFFVLRYYIKNQGLGLYGEKSDDEKWPITSSSTCWLEGNTFGVGSIFVTAGQVSGKSANVSIIIIILSGRRAVRDGRSVKLLLLLLLVRAVYFVKSFKYVSCEYDRLNGWNSTLQAVWYIRHVRWTRLFYVSFLRYSSCR